MRSPVVKPPGNPGEIFSIAHRCVRTGDVRLLASLLRAHPGLASWHDHPDGEGRRLTLLHEVAGTDERDWPGEAAEMAVALLNAGADADAPDLPGSGETPLHYAARLNNAEVCRVLLRAGAGTELTGCADPALGTPLGYALFFGAGDRLPRRQINCTDLLLRQGARIYLPFAAALGQLERVRQFFRPDHRLTPHAGLADSDKTLAQAFLFACQHGQTAVCEYLLYRGVDVNTRIPFFHFESTGLHLACGFSDNPETVAFLLGRGADPTLADGRLNATPAGWAMFHGQDRIFKLLQERGLV